MKKLKENLKQLENNIKLGKFKNDIKTIKEWGGADVIISKHKTPELKKWVDNESLIIDLECNDLVSPGNRLVISQYAKELSWLFYELKSIFSDYIDFSNKYQFYGTLAQSAIDFILNHKKYNPEELLCYVLNNGAYKIVKSIEN